MPDTSLGSSKKSAVDRLLSLAAEVRPGEGTTAVLLALNVFLLLAAYYTVRPIRSALLLPVKILLPGGVTLAGPEIQSYAGAILAALFLVIVPLYGVLASKVNRIRLINSVTMFFVVTLIAFFFISEAGIYPTVLAVTFFLWVGVFNLMIIAQFWSLANDIYTPDQGKRLFAIVGFGGSVGAIAGALVSTSMITRLGVLPMMLVGAAVLLVALGLANVINLREGRSPRHSKDSAASDKPLGTEGGFRLVLSQRYLLLIGLLTMTVNIVSTNGNYILSETLARMARAAVAGGGGQTEGEFIGAFMAGLDFWQNVLSMLIQFFLVSRIFKYLGVGGSLFVMPIIALCNYSLFAFLPVLSLIRVGKIAENATDYSLQSTVRRALFLPTSREAKYKALQAVETFFWRTGDMLSGVTTLVVVQWLALSVRGFAFVNIVLVGMWLVLAVRLARENRRLTTQAEPAAA
jgi:AAA family ATP:ADP antiporter